MKDNSAFVNDEKIYNKGAKAIPKPEINIGVDTKDTVINKAVSNVGKDSDNIWEESISSTLDLSSIESFASLSNSRDQVYALLDTMSEDSTVAAALEIYAEDATEYNDQGKIVWVESADSNIGKYITFLLDTLNVDKNVYQWVYSLCKYGDVYLRLYRKSDYEDDDILSNSIQDKNNNKGKVLNEDVNIIKYSKNDSYAHYVEMVPNPANVFELTKYGKTYAYIKTNTVPTAINSNDQLNTQYSYITQYKFKRNDVDIHGPMDYVHAALDDNSSRTPEEVSIFIEDKDTITDEYSTKSSTYTVNRGQSLLYNIFKIWRQLTLLENSVLLNRLTKSSIVRILGVEVGDMPKANVGHLLQRIKSMIEQKAAINTGSSLSEYTNPGPVENSIYVPTHDGKGSITVSQVGGDVNVGDLTDLDYFKNRFYGALGIPKQFMGDTEDGAGFNGGQSLSIISSRYAKRIKRIQNSICQMITDMVNLMLIDKGMNSYINKFTIHMLPPTTQEEIDRRENISSKVQITGDIMNNLNDIEDPVIKLKILKSLLANIVSNTDIVNLIQDQIDKLEKAQSETGDLSTESSEEDEDNEPLDFGSDLGLERPEGREEPEGKRGRPQPPQQGEEGSLPSPEDLGIDATNSNNPEVQ